MNQVLKLQKLELQNLEEDFLTPKSKINELSSHLGVLKQEVAEIQIKIQLTLENYWKNYHSELFGSLCNWKNRANLKSIMCFELSPDRQLFTFFSNLSLNFALCDELEEEIVTKKDPEIIEKETQDFSKIHDSWVGVSPAEFSNFLAIYSKNLATNAFSSAWDHDLLTDFENGVAVVPFFIFDRPVCYFVVSFQDTAELNYTIFSNHTRKFLTEIQKILRNKIYLA